MPGGGVALLYASKQLDDVKNTQNFDQKIGVDIVRKALLVPLKTIANNAGGLNLYASCCQISVVAMSLGTLRGSIRTW